MQILKAFKHLLEVNCITWMNGFKVINKQVSKNILIYMKHATTCNVIERCFVLLKMRWTILRSPYYYPIRTHNCIIIACCLLHNFIRQFMSVDPLENNFGEFVWVNDDLGEDDENIIHVIEPSNVWMNWRMELATQLFNEWQTSRQH